MDKLRNWIPILFLVALTSGCIDNDRTLVIEFMMPLEDDCSAVVQSGDDFVYLPFGVLDLAHPFFAGRPSYWMYPQVHNYMYPNANLDIKELESYKLSISQATVRFEWLKGKQEVLEDDPALSNLLALEQNIKNVTPIGVVMPAGSETGDPGQLVTMVEAIPPEVGQLLFLLNGHAQLDKLVLGVHTKIEGTTLGGRGVKSNDFVFPITFCSGCLSVEGFHYCVDPVSGATSSQVCMPGQDSPPPEDECP